MKSPICFLTILILYVGCTARIESSRFVDINGKAQHILDVGVGQPVIIFVTGFGDDLNAYRQIQKEVSRNTRTISYDRAGLGKSELTGKNRSLDTLVSELNEILDKENIPGPYIFVGHSYGGHIVRYFAYRHPEKVGGMVLIDPSVEHLDDEIRRVKTEDEVRSFDSLYLHGRDPQWSQGVSREADYFRSNEKLLREKNLEFSERIPTTVITAMKNPESRHLFLKDVNKMAGDLHKEWARNYPHIRHVLAERSGHYVHYDEPELVINEIRTILGIVNKD